MFNALTKEKSTFKFNNDDFEIYNALLESELLGKTGNQTAVNAAGSAWKKIIVRYKTSKQGESKTLNPKYLELKKLIENYIEIDTNKIEKGHDELKKLLSDNLKQFKEDSKFRKDCLSNIITSDYNFKKNIKIEYCYIVFCIYIALNYNYFTKDEPKKFLPITFSNIADFKKNYLEILNKDNYVITNLTCFSYTQYFWMDYRLSKSLHSEIHNIIYDIFSDLNKINKIEKKEQTEPVADAKFDAKEIMLRTLLSEEVQFIVPDYQREFTWNYDKEVRVFLKDFFDVYDKKTAKYFLGSIVLIEDNKKLLIIDGQQRLTTIIITLAILRELYSDDKFKETLNKYINYDFKEEGKLVQNHKLILNKNNQEFFRRYITSRISENDRGSDWKCNNDINDSNMLIYKSYKEIKKTIIDKFKSKLNDSIIDEIEMALLDNFFLIKIVVPNEQMANKIFETLNDRGRPLKTHENIKNHIFGRVDFEFEVLRDKWNELVKLYGKHFENNMIQVYKSNYVKNYKNLTKNNFFSHFKANKEITDYHKFVSLLEEEISIFKNLIAPTKEFWEDKELLWNLKLIEAFEVNSVYLTLLSSYKKDFYFKEVLIYSVKAVFRNEFSMQKPFDINVASTKISKEIRDFSDEDVKKRQLFLKQNVEDELYKCIKSSDDLIKTNFLFKKIYDKNSNKNIALKILKLINQFENDDNAIDWNCFTTEHIFSQTLSSSDSFKSEITKIETDYEKKYKKKFSYNENSIYNLTLLPAEDNGKASHIDFKDKIEYYKKYKLPTNDKLVELYDKYKVFNLDLIEEYQNFLWDKIKNIFHL